VFENSLAGFIYLFICLFVCWRFERQAASLAVGSTIPWWDGCMRGVDTATWYPEILPDYPVPFSFMAGEGGLSLIIHLEP
jgi:hypothetical protein